MLSYTFLGLFFQITNLQVCIVIIKLTILYGYEVWGPSLLLYDWAKVEREKSLLLQCMIGCNQIVSKDIIYVEFGAYPIETIFKLVSFLHKDTIFK